MGNQNDACVYKNMLIKTSKALFHKSERTHSTDFILTQRQPFMATLDGDSSLLG